MVIRFLYILLIIVFVAKILGLIAISWGWIIGVAVGLVVLSVLFYILVAMLPFIVMMAMKGPR